MRRPQAGTNHCFIFSPASVAYLNLKAKQQPSFTRTVSMPSYHHVVLLLLLLLVVAVATFRRYRRKATAVAFLEVFFRLLDQINYPLCRRFLTAQKAHSQKLNEEQQVSASKIKKKQVAASQKIVEYL